MARALVIIVLLLTLGCGDGIIIFSVNLGVISGPPSCSGGGGRFNLQEQEGLLLVVILTSSSSIVLANGQRGTCADLAANDPVEVNGRRSGDQISAKTVTVH